MKSVFLDVVDFTLIDQNNEYLDKLIKKQNVPSIYELNHIFSKSKEFKIEISKFIESKLISNPEITPSEMLSIILTHYPEYEQFFPLSLSDAKEIDNMFYCKGGNFFISSINFSNESIDKVEWNIKNVGIFTCDIYIKL